LSNPDSMSVYLVEKPKGLAAAVAPLVRITSPKGPKLVVRDFAGSGLFTGQYARFAQQAVFRKVLRERSGRRQTGSPGRRSRRSVQQLKEDAGTVPFTGADCVTFRAGRQAPFTRLSRGDGSGRGPLSSRRWSGASSAPWSPASRGPAGPARGAGWRCF